MERLRRWAPRIGRITAKGSIATRAEGLERLFPVLIALACGLLVYGLTTPIMRVSQLFIFTDRVSIIGVIGSLFGSGNWLLAVVVLVFSIVFPTVKILAAGYAWAGWPAHSDRIGKTLGFLDWVGRWSMLDVLVAALIVFSVKASAVGDAMAEPGLYAFAAAVISAAVAVALLKKAAKRIRETAVAPDAPPDGP